MPRPSAPAGPCIWRTWQSPNDARSSALIVASASATLGLAGLATYGADKAGVAALVRSPAADLAESLVTANAISPGATAGTMLAKAPGSWSNLVQTLRLRTGSSQAPAMVSSGSIFTLAGMGSKTGRSGH